MFFTYNQNNSGGGFAYDEKRGISHYVIIEADDAVEANDKAEGIGLYFDGDGDCPCCGDRWCASDKTDGTEFPSVYDEIIEWGENVQETMPGGQFMIKWMNGYEGFVHYKNGDIAGFWKNQA